MNLNMADHNAIFYTTIEARPLTVVDDNVSQTVKIAWVRLAVRTGIEVVINASHMTDPGADCWFAVKLDYCWLKRDGSPDCDILITNGDEFYLCRRGLGKTKLILNRQLWRRIKSALRRYVSTL
jgi:hypothetical protein